MTSIVFTADETYLPYLPCNFAQLARFGRKADSVALIAPPRLDGALRARIENAAAEHDLRLRVTVASELDRLYSGALIDDYWYMSTSKLFLGDLLPDLDDVLYLDVDTLVRAPLDELLGWELRNPIGGVVELHPGGTHLFGTSRQPYFNAGVLRISLDRIRREKVGERALEILATNVLTLQDQDVFNLLFMDRFDSLPMTYNVFDVVARAHGDLAALRDPVIVHFAGSNKPWTPGSRSRFAREWRRLYSSAVLKTDRAPSQDLALPGSGEGARNSVSRLIRAVLPSGAKRGTQNAVLEVLDSTQRKIETIRASVSPGSRSAHPLSWGIQFRGSADQSADSPDARTLHRRIDLLISLPNSGTRALGDAIRHSHPGIRFLPDLLQGVATGLDNEQELRRRFRWFTPVDPESLTEMTPRQVFEAQREFASGISDDVVEFVDGVADGGSDRYLIAVRPDQLNPSALCELLRVSRPRLVFLRRIIAFSYTSQIADSASVPIDSRQAYHFATRCDAWIDGVADLAVRLGLDQMWLTYDGLFKSGADVGVLEAFYPGSTFSVDRESGCLQLGRRNGPSDDSIIAMANAFAELSPAAKAQLLRLPGREHLGAERGAQITSNG